jgi:transposase
VHDRHDLTDVEWEQLEPLLPDRMPRRGGRWCDHRMVINGVLWRTRTGSPWRDLPLSYGNWKTVYSRHRRWSGDGTWEKILEGLRGRMRPGAGSGVDGRHRRDRGPRASARRGCAPCAAQGHPGPEADSAATRPGSRARAGALGCDQPHRRHRGLSRMTRIRRWPRPRALIERAWGVPAAD